MYMKKILLLLVMVIAVSGAQAKRDRLYASFGTLNNANIASGNLSFTTTSNANMVLFTFTSGELANYSTLHFKITKVSTTSGAGNLYRLQFRNGSTELKTTDNYTTEDLMLDLSSLGITLSDVTDIRLLGPQYQTSVITLSVKDVYLENATDSECMSISTTINSSSSKTVPFTWELGGNNPTIYARFGTSIEAKGTALFGSDNAGPTSGYYFDVTGYDYAIADLKAYTGGDLRYFNKEGEVTTTATSYIALSGTQHITTIKGGENNSNSKAITVNTVDFVKDFASSSTTAFEIAASTSSTISYDRVFTANQASTVCFPFALTQDECNAAGVFYELTDFDGTTLTFTEVTSGGTTAYKPYLFKATATGAPFSDLTARAITASSEATTSYTTADNNGYTATMTGTLAKQSVNGKYGWNSVGGAFSKATSNEVTIDAFRAYITLNGVPHARVAARFVGDNVTGINEVKSQKTEENDILYSPSGQRVSADYKGIVIKNGRKYFKE